MAVASSALRLALEMTFFTLLKILSVVMSMKPSPVLPACLTVHGNITLLSPWVARRVYKLRLINNM